VRAGHALNADRVDVAAEQERPPAAATGRANQHARPPWGVLEQFGMQPVVVCPTRDERGDLRLAGATGDERRVDGVDCDEPREQLGELGAQRRRQP
jgi:hypothetical protein